ncbi:MAG: MBL fold metallo-hydrolase [Bacillota bacterium]|jgi:glyoxylase-like metal-dependent hydrolase (beta-lactamase superfamily II)
MIMQICKNLHLLKGKKPTRFPYCNCLLIEDKIRTVIDTGLELAVIQECQPEQVELVINSHSHEDHTNGNRAFTQAKIAIHRLDAEMITSLAAFTNSFIGRWEELMSVPLNFDIDFDYPATGLTFQDSRVVRWPESRVDLTFDEGDILDLGAVKLTVIHTPGHTPGHSCFYWEQEGILISADIDLTRNGPWYGDTTSDLDQLIASVYRIRDLQPRLLIPGHGRLVTNNLQQRVAAYLDHVFQRDEKILQTLHQPQTLAELADQHLISNDPRPLIQYWEKVMLLKHLERLERKGLIKQSDGQYYR